MIDLQRQTEWVQVCGVEQNELYFTPEYLAIVGCLGGKARQLACHLVAGWDKRFETLLDYFGPSDVEEDWFTGIDGKPMDVCEDLPEMLVLDQTPIKHLSAEWHRDLYRAKLATLKVPRRLLEEFVKATKTKEFI